jgi:hypothetical protein
MKMTKTALAATLFAVFLAPAAANAAFVLDTGTPTAAALGSSGTPLVLDGNDFYAAEFNLSAGQTVNSISAYLMAGLDSPGDTFTIALYSASDFGNRNAVQQFAGQATYTADGWNGLTGVNFTATTAGQYWAAVEVGAADTATGLDLPTPLAGGTAPARAFAYNAGSGYTSAGALPFGIQVDATTPVPLPAAFWLLGSGTLGLGSMLRRRRTGGFTG